MTKLVTVLLAGAALALAGCGDDSGSGGGGGASGMAQCVKGMEATFKGKGEQICKCAEGALKASSIKDDDKKKLLASFTTPGSRRRIPHRLPEDHGRLRQQGQIGAGSTATGML